MSFNATDEEEEKNRGIQDLLADYSARTLSGIGKESSQTLTKSTV